MPCPLRPSASTISAWQNRRFGLFIHWGLYSIPAGVWQDRQIEGYNEQIQAHAHIPKGKYASLANLFNPTLWDPEAVVALAKDAGMKFVVITSKHHDGFSLFKTSQSQFNVVDATPFGRDIVAGLAEACARAGLGFGVYFSTIDWNFEGATPIDYEPDSGVRNDNVIPDVHAQFNAAQLTELLTNYGPISEVWFDMGKPTPDQSKLFADTVHQLQPETMVSGRVFNYQGDFTVMGDNEIPSYRLEEPWQSPASIFHETWGYRSWQPRDDLASKIAEHIKNLVRVVSRGGNYLLNIGPRGDGSIVEFEADVLRGIGSWLSENATAIEETGPQPFRQLSFGAATTKGNHLYLFILEWPNEGVLRLPGLETPIVSARYLNGCALEFNDSEEVKYVVIGAIQVADIVPVIDVELAGPAIVAEPTIKPNAAKELVLSEVSGDKFYHRNGHGYSDPPKLYKLRWFVESATSGRFQVKAHLRSVDKSAMFQMKVGDQLLVRAVHVGESPELALGDVELPLNGVMEVSISPIEPFDKGIALEIAVDRITFAPSD